MFNTTNKPRTAPLGNEFLDAEFKTQKDKIGHKYIKKGWNELEGSNYPKAFIFFNKALKFFSNKKNPMGEILALHGIASIFYKVGEYYKAIEVLFTILSRIKSENKNLKFITLKDISKTYYEWGFYNESIEYLIKAKKLIQLKDLYKQIYVYFNLGRSFLKINKLEKAQENLFLCLTICDNNNLNYMVSHALTLQGNIFRKQHNFLRAENFHIRALQYARTEKDHEMHIDIINNLGNLCFYAKEYAKAINFFETATIESNKLGILNKNLKSLKGLYLCFNEMGNPREAAKYLHKLFSVSLEITNKRGIIQNEILDIQKKLHFTLDNDSEILNNVNYELVQGYASETIDLRDINTNLPLEPLFIELLNQGIKETKRSNSKLGIFVVNISLGIEKRGTFLSEDLALCEHVLIEKLEKNIRAEDILGKIDSDNYLLAIKTENDINGCKTFASRIIAILENPIYTENQKVSPVIKIGITLYPENALTPEELISKSRIAVKRITRENTSNLEFYNSIHNIATID